MISALPTRSIDSKYFQVLGIGLVLVLAFAVLSHQNLFFWAMFRFGHQDIALGLVVVAMVIRPLLSLENFRRAFLALSLVCCALQLGFKCAVVFGYVALTIVVARLRFPVLPRALLLFVVWVAVVLFRLRVSIDEIPKYYTLYVYWVGLPFAAFYLIVERARGTLRDGVTWRDEALYLLALPRFITPFFQPISPSKFLMSEQRELSVGLAARGLALGLYGAFLHFLLFKIVFVPPPRPDALPPVTWVPSALVPLSNLLFIYASNASQIFCAVGLFRVLGFDLSSGFRWPLAATSFADFFRRWNTYVYEDVMSLFFFPLLGHLRRWMSDRAASMIGAYLAIFLGSYCLSAVLVPFALNADPIAGLLSGLEPKQVFAYALYWSGIVLPQYLPRSASLVADKLPARIVKRALFILVMISVGWIAGKMGAVVI